MNLLQVRTKFREVSGRFDLVNSDYSDNGADFYINQGARFLDRMDETQKSWGSAFITVKLGFWYAPFKLCRAVKEAWCTTASAKWQLEKKSLQDLVEGYLTGLPSSRNTGNPLYYAPCITRYIPETLVAEDIDAFMGFVDIPAGDVHEYNAILLNVPVSEDSVVKVNGLFYSEELVDDVDENYWTVAHPLLLIMAAQRQLEVMNRNTQGVNDWTNSIAVEMKQIGSDLVEELIAEADQMEG